MKIRNGLSCFGIASEYELNKMLKKVDADGSGVIEFFEFVSVMVCAVQGSRL